MAKKKKKDVEKELAKEIKRKYPEAFRKFSKKKPYYEELGIEHYGEKKKGYAQRLVEGISEYDEGVKRKVIEETGRNVEKELAKEIKRKYPEAFRKFSKKKPYYEELDIKTYGVQRKKSAQDIIDESSSRESQKELKRFERQRSIEKFKSHFERPQKFSSSVRDVDRKVGSRVRKAIHLVSPKGGIVKRLTTPPGKKVKGRRRGRPKQTYKTRVLPSGKIVKVPTHIYNKMLSQEKSAMRLARAQKQASYQQQYEAEQLAMQQDPRFQQTAESAWANSEDMEHQARVQEFRQRQSIQPQTMEQQMQYQRPSIIKRAGEMFSKSRISLMGRQQQSPQQFSQRPQIQPSSRPNINMDLHRPVNPQVIVTGGKSPMFGNKNNIMTQRNEFNETNRKVIGFGR